MKNIFLPSILALVLSTAGSLSLAATASQLEAVQLLDGKVVRCVEEMDLRNRGYKVENPQSTINDSSITLSLTAISIQCKKNQDRFAAEEVPFGSPLRYSYPIEADRNIDVEISYKSTEFLITDEDFNVLSITPANEQLTKLDLSAEFPRSFLLTAKDEQKLLKGETVKKRLGLVSRSLVRIRNSDGLDYNDGYQGGGSYTLFLTVFPNGSAIFSHAPRSNSN